MRFSANAAQAIKYEKRRGKSSAKRNGMSTVAMYSALQKQLEHVLMIRGWFCLL